MDKRTNARTDGTLETAKTCNNFADTVGWQRHKNNKILNDQSAEN